MISAEDQKKLDTFLEGWQEDASGIKQVFLDLKAHVAAYPEGKVIFIDRPGVSYSYRVAHARQKARQLFVMVDVIDDDPANRWLSICFYGDMITDPEEMGDLIPGGLLGDDGYCFDLDEGDGAALAYIRERLDQAYARAGQ